MEGLSSIIPIDVRTSNKVVLHLLGSTRTLEVIKSLRKRSERKGRLYLNLDAEVIFTKNRINGTQS